MEMPTQPKAGRRLGKPLADVGSQHVIQSFIFKYFNFPFENIAFSYIVK
jgi:hypothetical protein